MVARNAALAVALAASITWGGFAHVATGETRRTVLPGASLTRPANPPTIRLRPVTGASKQDRLVLLVRAAGVPLPLSLALPNPGQIWNQLDCDLSTESVHARKSSNFTKIGPKPMTVCAHRVQLIMHETTLRYFKAGKWRAAEPRYSDYDKDLRTHISLKIEHPCKGVSATQWVSETTAIVIDRGRFFTGTIKSTPVRLPCAP